MKLISSLSLICLLTLFDLTAKAGDDPQFDSTPANNVGAVVPTDGEWAAQPTVLHATPLCPLCQQSVLTLTDIPSTGSSMHPSKSSEGGQ